MIYTQEVSSQQIYNVPHFHIKPVKRNPTLQLNKIDKRTQTKLQQTKSEEQDLQQSLSFFFYCLKQTNGFIFTVILSFLAN